jgi:hypothetical protein
MQAWHDLTRNYADTFVINNAKARLIPGTKEFEDSLRAITSRTAFEEGGNAFF